MRMYNLTVLLPLAMTASLALAQGGDRNHRGAMHDQNTGMVMVDKSMAVKVISGWPEDSKKAAMTTMETYGPPQEATASMLIWKNNGPWMKTVIFNEAVQHDFPVPHKDVMQQWIAYKAPWDKYDELAAYDGSVVAERTNGVLSARCDKEGANFLAINLANDVALGKKSAAEAREYHAKAIDAFMKEQKMDVYMKRLMFAPMVMSRTADPDKPATTELKASMK